MPAVEPAAASKEFLHYCGKPLSARAALNFRSRTCKGSLRFPDGLLDTLYQHMVLPGGVLDDETTAEPPEKVKKSCCRGPTGEQSRLAI